MIKYKKYLFYRNNAVMVSGYLKKEYTHYLSMLDLRPGATDRDIKAAFRAGVLKYHPDRNPGDKGAEEKFRQICQAFKALIGQPGAAGRIRISPDTATGFVPFCKAPRQKEAEIKLFALKHEFIRYLKKTEGAETGRATKTAFDTIINLAAVYGYNASDDLRELLSIFCDRKQREVGRAAFGDVLRMLKQICALAEKGGFHAEGYCRGIILEFCRCREMQAAHASVADIKTFVRQIRYLEKKFSCSTRSVEKIRERFFEHQEAIRTVSRVIKNTRDRLAGGRRKRYGGFGAHHRGEK